MRRCGQQLFSCLVLLFCSLASCHAKPRISFEPEGWESPLDSNFGTGWNNSEADQREDGPKEADNLEATSNTPPTNHNQPIRFPGQTNIQPIEFLNQGSTTDIQPFIFPGPTDQKPTNNNEPIKFPGPTIKGPRTNSSSIKFPGPTNQSPATTRENRCNLPSETGWCRARFEMWYFDTNSGDCEPFIYGGCEGNDNRFSSKEECRDVCLVSSFP